MTISARSIPAGTKITVWGEPVLGRPGLMALSPRIASVFARWSVLEKQLNQLFTLVTDADPEARIRFDALHGWDRRTQAIISEANDRLDEASADLAGIVLRLVKIPASKRDELAHRVWAVVEGHETELGLLPPDDQHTMAEAVVAVKNAGRCDIPIDNSSWYEGSSLVSAADLDRLIGELENAKVRMEALIFGHFYPDFADQTGSNFSDYRDTLKNDIEIRERLINVGKARKGSERAERRNQSAQDMTTL